MAKKNSKVEFHKKMSLKNQKIIWKKQKNCLVGTFLKYEKKEIVANVIYQRNWLLFLMTP